MDILLKRTCNYSDFYCVNIVQIRSFSGLHFPVFGLNTEIYGVNLYIQFKYGKYGVEKTPYLGTFQAVFISDYYFYSLNLLLSCLIIC